ncbi:rhomboid family intramembrane serine protease [Solitalea sp. MAHUQ-68]|uniref:Rhomboid family intramembrane serine protease n=1 Tax=Solitalea agri TaxID=2953739 RepID=A0A9X2FA09_9SPHI|nr:rhomboid family intramembrane serine protease [Solitalea agri]MCO4293158.1 rhomboid family intramembrane serine protease [Solitalea agri]
MSLVEELKQVLFRPRRKLHQFIAINVFVFFVIKLIFAVEFVFKLPINISAKVVEYSMLPASLDILIKRPWTLFTYMFLHTDFFHLLFNMIGLYWFGQLLEEYLGGKKFAIIYILGGLTGGLLFIALYNLLPAYDPFVAKAQALGASAGVLAIIVATATLLPDYQLMVFLFGLIKLKYIAVLFVLLDLINITGSNAGGHIAHLGGAILGFIYIKQLHKGRDFGSPFSALGKKIANFFKRKPKLKVAYKNTGNDRKNVKKQVDKQEIIDRILDKISKHGYEGLTKEEKETLFRASQEKE